MTWPAGGQGPAQMARCANDVCPIPSDTLEKNEHFFALAHQNILLQVKGHLLGLVYQMLSEGPPPK